MISSMDKEVKIFAVGLLIQVFLVLSYKKALLNGYHVVMTITMITMVVMMV